MTLLIQAAEGQTYVYQAYVVVSGTGSHASEQKYFYASGTRFFKAWLDRLTRFTLSRV